MNATRQAWTAAKAAKQGRWQTSPSEAIEKLREPSPDGPKTNLDSLGAALQRLRNVIHQKGPRRVWTALAQPCEGCETGKMDEDGTSP